MCTCCFAQQICGGGGVFFCFFLVTLFIFFIQKNTREDYEYRLADESAQMAVSCCSYNETIANHS